MKLVGYEFQPKNQTPHQIVDKGRVASDTPDFQLPDEQVVQWPGNIIPENQKTENGLFHRSEMTTMAVGEEGRLPGYTTKAVGEEGQTPKPPLPRPPSRPDMSTMALGEEGPPAGYTTKAVGEEGQPPKPSFPRPPSLPEMSTMAVGEEGRPPSKPETPVHPRPPQATTKAIGEEGQPPKFPHPKPRPTRPQPGLTTLMVGEEGQPQENGTTWPPSLGGYQVPSSVMPIYADDAGNHFVGVPTEDGMQHFPFIPGTPTNVAGGIPDGGGYVPIQAIPKPGNMNGNGQLGQELTKDVSDEESVAWAAGAAAQAMLGMAPGGMYDQVLNHLGIDNPIANTALSAAMGSALTQAGLDIPGMPGSGAISADQIAQQLADMGMGELMESLGLDELPGGEELQQLLTEQLGNYLGDLLGEVGLDDALESTGFVADADSSLSKADLTDAALEKATEYLMDMWKIDDKSSAGETIANHFAKKLMDQLGKNPKEWLKELKKLKDKIKDLIKGAKLGEGAPIILMCRAHMDNEADQASTGFCPVTVKGAAVSRQEDMVIGPKAPAPGKKIIKGEASVLTGKLPTAFEGSATEVPSIMQNGDDKVLVGGPDGTAAAKAKKAKLAAAASKAPTSPSAPSSTSGDSGDGNGSPAGNSPENSGQSDEETVGDGKHKLPTEASSGDTTDDSGRSNSTDPDDGSQNEAESTDGKPSESDEGTEQPPHSGEQENASHMGNLSVEDAKDASKIAYNGKEGDTTSDGEWKVKEVREDHTGFRAVVLESTDPTDDRVIVAFAGTDIKTDVPGAINDLVQDGEQAIGSIPPQYHRARQLVGELKDEYGNSLVVTGHSLGGGMANYAGAIHDVPGVGLNSAPLGVGARWHINSVNPTAPDKFTHYNNRHDPISNRLVPGVQLGHIYEYQADYGWWGPGLSDHAIENIDPGNEVIYRGTGSSRSSIVGDLFKQNPNYTPPKTPTLSPPPSGSTGLWHNYWEKQRGPLPPGQHYNRNGQVVFP